MFDNSVILITGGTGSFGQSFVSALFEEHQPKKVIVYSRDELKQFEMQNSQCFSKNKARLRYFIGDIRDKERLSLAFNGVDYVVHAAALKQIPSTEYNPFEAVKTNILGSQNVIDAAVSQNVKKVIALSTDKAVEPINLYGATKLAADKLFVAANNYVGQSTRFAVVRYGNVVGSRGSVIPLFLEKRGSGKLPITDTRMTRFHISLKDGVKFVLDSFERMWGGEIFVPKIPSCKIIDIAKAVSPDADHDVVGIRPGEKLHEVMITSDDAPNTIEYEKYFVILPYPEYFAWTRQDYIEKAGDGSGRFCDPNFRYSSRTNSWLLSPIEIEHLLDRFTETG
jgi:UDP-N-acetylglucosamine 4,6-dehydratase/5-epimerase